MVSTFERMTFQLIKAGEGFIGQVHYDSRGIPTLGCGLALILWEMVRIK